jgi:hypothetical protein
MAPARIHIFISSKCWQAFFSIFACLGGFGFTVFEVLPQTHQSFGQSDSLFSELCLCFGIWVKVE